MASFLIAMTLVTTRRCAKPDNRFFETLLKPWTRVKEAYPRAEAIVTPLSCKTLYLLSRLFVRFIG